MAGTYSASRFATRKMGLNYLHEPDELQRVFDLCWTNPQYEFVAAFAGFLLADATLIFAAGLPAVRKFFLTHGVAVTRVVGVIFILFDARSIADAVGSAMRRTAQIGGGS